MAFNGQFESGPVEKKFASKKTSQKPLFTGKNQEQKGLT